MDIYICQYNIQNKMFRWFVSVIVMAIMVLAEEDCESNKVFTSIDQTNSTMNSLEDQSLATNAVINATVKGGTELEIVANISDTLNPVYKKDKTWIIVQLLATYKFYAHYRLYITACKCQICKDYLVAALNH